MLFTQTVLNSLGSFDQLINRFCILQIICNGYHSWSVRFDSFWKKKLKCVCGFSEERSLCNERLWLSAALSIRSKHCLDWFTGHFAVLPPVNSAVKSRQVSLITKPNVTNHKFPSGDITICTAYNTICPFQPCPWISEKTTTVWVHMIVCFRACFFIEIG